MKKAAFIFLFFLILSSSLQANYHFNEESLSSDSNELILDIEKVLLCKEGIFTRLNGRLIELESITYNGNHFSGKLRASLGWICPKCGFDNGCFSNTCGGCGYKPSAPTE